MKRLHQHLSQAEWTIWMMIGIMLALVLASVYLFWQKVSL